MSAAVARSDDGVARAWSVRNEGLLLLKLGEHDRAGALLERAVELEERVLGPEHPDVGLSLTHLAAVHHHRGDHDRAAALARRALAILEPALGAQHPDVSLPLITLGAALSEGPGDLEQAATVLERAQTILAATLPDENPTRLLAYHTLGNVRRELGQSRDAIGSLNGAQRNQLRTNPAHPELGAVYASRAYADISAGDLADAELDLRRGLALLTRGPNPELSWALLVQGALAMAQRRPAEAVTAYERALAISPGRLRAEIQLGLARALAAAGRDPARASALAGEALAYWRRVGHRRRIAEVTAWLAERAPR
jgi:tetratricopeptide (TPR) repeat protein